MFKDAKIYIAGHRGMVGAATYRALYSAGYKSLITRNHSELDLLDQATVNDFFKTERPDVAVIAAARVGGLTASDAAQASSVPSGA